MHPYTKMLLSSIPVVTEEEEAMKPDQIGPGEIPLSGECAKRMYLSHQMQGLHGNMQDNSASNGGSSAEHMVCCHKYTAQAIKKEGETDV
ncbi:MAG: hypothetical protein ACLVJO_10225 [[Clostridium] scindens]